MFIEKFQFIMKTNLKNTYYKICSYDHSVKSNMKYDPGTSPF